ncbi:solute carrier family 13 member [Elysia marginata]|uniref:Solute carrier family 13 member n=1 Tax=Elysia marginata TaxID=1093978 RepID=A0AAV4GXD7_9GAST|nr:solute carrier family 13 member [Elysia marginata]
MTGVLRSLRLYWRQILVIVLPILLSPLAFPDSQTSTESKCLYLVLLTAIFWIVELLPIPVTSLLPVALRPVLGISAAKDGIKVFFNDTTMLLLGAITVAIALEVTMLHKRMAYMVLNWIGLQPRRLLFGIMLMSAFLSMWISNTAAASMMLPITKALLQRLYAGETGNDEKTEIENEKIESKASGKDGVLGENEDGKSSVIEIVVTAAAAAAAVVVVVVVVVVEVVTAAAAVVAVLVYRLGNKQEVELAARKVRHELDAMGPVRFNEKIVLAHFLVMVILWLTRRPGFITGWSAFFPDEGYMRDSTVAVAVAISLFIFTKERPAVFCFRLNGDDRAPRSVPSLLSWKDVSKKLPWGVIILIGGGSVLVDTIKVTGLSESVKPYMLALQSWPSWLVCLLVIVFTCLTTELCSNTVIAILILPLLKDLHYNNDDDLDDVDNDDNDDAVVFVAAAAAAADDDDDDNIEEYDGSAGLKILISDMLSMSVEITLVINRVRCNEDAADVDDDDGGGGDDDDDDGDDVDNIDGNKGDDGDDNDNDGGDCDWNSLKAFVMMLYC